uniref:Uncharacterized protein n=1 Tax=Globisporangium ultimum (strain ATCC 200006 / CBS 805.95 / DAOM BR144) TaxID=431595 RepID=K3WYV7_GLOUD
MEYEDKHAFPPANRSRVGSPRHSVSSVSSMSSVKNSPAPPSNAKSFANSPTPTNLRTRHSESELHSPRNRSQMDEYPRYEAKKKMSADFSDDTMSVGSIGGESPKSDKGSWRIHSAVAGPFLTGPLARDFRSEDLKTPRGKARDDMNFDQTGLLFPLAPVLDVIPDTPRGPHRYHSQGFTDVSRFGNNAQALDGFNLDGGAAAYPSEPARPTTAFNSARRGTNPQVHDNNYANYANQSDYESAQYAADGQQYNHENGHQSSAIVASQGNSSASHAPSYAGIVARNAASSSEQSLVSSSSTASDSLETLTKGMADSMAQILAKTQNGRSYGEVQLTTLVQKIHMHMNIMGRTSAAIREDYNKIKAKLEQTITDKKVLEATNYHLQQLVQQYEVERQYFHQYVLHSLQSQSSLIYESMGNLTQNVAQSKYTIEELSARLSQELTNMRGSHTNGNESQLKDILEEIKRAVDMSVLHNQNNNNGTQHSFDAGSHSNQASSRSPHANSTPSKADSTRKEQDAAGSGKFVPFLLALLLWVATLAGVYYGAKSSALSELQGQQPSSSSSGALLPSDLDSIVDQISQKLESVVQTSDVRKLVYSELTENPHLVESIGSVVDKDSTDPATSSDSKFTIDASDIVNEITPASEDLSADDIIARTESSVGTEDAEDDSDADGSVESVIPPSESPVEDQESSPLIDPIEPSIISVPDNELDVSAFESSAAGVIEVIDTTYDVAVEPELIESSDDEAQIDVATADEIEAIEPSTGDIETAVESLDEDADPISPSLVSSQEKSSTVDADILEIDESAKTEGEKEPETTLEVEDALSGKSDKQPEDVIVADLTGSAESPAAAASMTTNVGGDVDASTTLATETSVNDPESSKSTALEDTETSFEPADTSEEAVLPSDDE